MARRRAPAVALGLAAVLLSIGLSASKHVIVDGPEAASGGPGVDCTSACTFAVRAVCGADGEWYQNDCLAACSGGVAPGDAKLCEGKPLPFMDARPGPRGAESAALNASALLVPSAVVSRFVKDGFRYVGRIRLARDMAGPPPRGAAGANESLELPDVGRDGHWNVKAVRCTPEGDVYIGLLKIPSRALKLDSYVPPWMKSARPLAPLDGNSTLLDFASSLGIIPGRKDGPGGAGGSGYLIAPRLHGKKEKGRLSALLSDFFSLFQAGGGAADKLQPAAEPAAAVAPAAVARRARSLKELVGSDDRTDCQRGFPYTAIGQIQAVDNTGLYICTGTLIAPDKVLTAGHCVWNINRGAFYYNLNYAPGRFRDGGKVVNPWGVVPWKSVTVFDSFKKNPSSWDVAVITLAKPLGQLTGYMGVASGCGKNLQLTTAGYPQDKGTGTCMAAACAQPRLDCDSPTNEHSCDTKNGMSGAPMWDGKSRVRMIHVAGVEGMPENRATTLTQFLVNTIAKW